MIRIVVADDHKLFREVISEVLSSKSGFSVIAQCSDSNQAIAIAQSEKPDIVLMDINIGPVSGIKATETIKASTPSKVIALTMHSHTSYAKQMLRAGAIGYVTKNSSTEEIFLAVTETAKGNKYICSEMKTNLSDEMLNHHPDAPSIGLLTEREIEIVHLIRSGFSSKEIAVTLSTALKTVEVHRYNILRKLKLKNSSSLVNFIYSNNVLM